MGDSLSPSAPLPVLVVSADVALREVLADLLTEGGYVPLAVSSLDEALEFTERRTIALILAEVFAAASPHAWDNAHALLRRAHPTPVGLLLTHAQIPDSASRAGFAFMQPMPFEIDDLLGRVASAVARPLTPEQQRWAAVVERYYAALAATDWEGMLALFTDDIIYYPPHDSGLASLRRLTGKAAVRDYYEAAAVSYHHITCTDVLLFPRPYGLLAHHTLAWLDDEGRMRSSASTLRLRFDGDRIRQISVTTRLARLRDPVEARPA